MSCTIRLAHTGPAALSEALTHLALDDSTDNASAPLAAIALGVSLAPSDLVFHCDLVRVRDGRMIEAPAVAAHFDGHFSRLEPIAARLTMQLHALCGPSALLVHREGWPFDFHTHNPQTLVGRSIAGNTPRGAGDEVMRDFMESGAALLGDGLTPWVWGGGRLPTLPRVEPLGVLVGGGLEIAGLAKLIGWRWEQGSSR